MATKLFCDGCSNEIKLGPLDDGCGGQRYEPRRRAEFSIGTDVSSGDLCPACMQLLARVVAKKLPHLLRQEWIYKACPNVAPQDLEAATCATAPDVGVATPSKTIPMSASDVKQTLISLLEGMLSPKWQQPSDLKIVRMLAQLRNEEPASLVFTELPASTLLRKRQRLMESIMQMVPGRVLFEAARWAANWLVKDRPGLINGESWISDAYRAALRQQPLASSYVDETPNEAIRQEQERIMATPAECLIYEVGAHAANWFVELDSDLKQLPGSRLAIADAYRAALRGTALIDATE